MSRKPADFNLQLVAGILFLVAATLVPPVQAQGAMAEHTRHLHMAPTLPLSSSSNQAIGTKTALLRKDLTDRSEVLNLSLTYAQRVGVPKGSEIEVIIRDSTGKLVYEGRSQTEDDAPPYALAVPIKGTDFPLSIQAKLTSIIGHTFLETVELKNSPDLGRPIGIVMHLQ